MNTLSKRTVVDVCGQGLEQTWISSLDVAEARLVTPPQSLTLEKVNTDVGLHFFGPAQTLCKVSFCLHSVVGYVQAATHTHGNSFDLVPTLC